MVEDRHHAPECFDELLDFVGRQLWLCCSTGFQCCDLCGGEVALVLHFGGPGGDQGGVGSGFECGPVLGELAIVRGECPSCVAEGGGVVGLGLLELVEGVVDAVGGEDAGEPVVEGAAELVFADVDGAGVVDVVGEYVLGGVAAAVVGAPVVPVALHSSSAGFVDDQAAVGVRVLFAVQDAAGRGGSARGEPEAYLVEDFAADEGGVCGFVREYPVGLGVPGHLCLVAQGDIVHVDQ
ncbi:hypothetical protein [Nocardia transvalensis]|uniref:hypothetical protein n=1 Tax=Nocardia transvalensis TaxID=37333 RepID=UPI001FE5D0F4|nr:hypothetical protein [Nocardia transvalensis]